MIVWGLGWATVARAATVQEVAAAIATCGDGLVEPLPSLDVAQVGRLAVGEVVRVVLPNPDPDGASSAVGLAVLPGTLAELWVAVQDPHAQVDPSLTEFVIEQKGPDHAIWYGYLDLPRPIQDRQWMVESTNHHALAARTGNRCWEHNWRLVEQGVHDIGPLVARGEPRGLTGEHVAGAIYTPVNHGQWLLAPLPGGTETLVVYQATSVIGGNIPAWLVLQLTMSRLESGLLGAGARARDWAPGHYRAGHEPLVGADGAVLALFP